MSRRQRRHERRRVRMILGMLAGRTVWVAVPERTWATLYKRGR